jgi:hypothetical protein
LFNECISIVSIKWSAKSFNLFLSSLPTLSLPKLSIEKHINEEPPREFQINIIGDNGEVLETHNNVLDENFNFSNMAGGNSSK